MSDVMESLKAYVDTAAVKTSEVIDSTLKYVDAAKIEKQLTGLYARLGRAEFNTRKGIKDESELSEKLVARIEVVQKELKQARRAYEMTRSVKCLSCGHKNPAAGKFCSRCGESLNNDK